MNQKCCHNILDETDIPCSDEDCIAVTISKAIWENYSSPGLTVESLAEKLELSIDTLYKYSKRHFGCTPKKLVNCVRIYKSMDYYYNVVNVSEIGEKVGFFEEKTYRNVLRSFVDVSPRELKKYSRLYENHHDFINAMKEVILEKLQH